MKKSRFIAVSIILVFAIIIGLSDSGIFNFGSTSGTSQTTEYSSKSSTSSTPHPSDNNSYTKLFLLTERLLTYPDSPMGKNVSILLGEIPGDLPVKVPVPNNADIIGSLVRSDGQYKQVEIILDIPSPQNETIEFYRNSLTKAGWNESKGFQPFQGEGFVPASPMPESFTFCQYQRKGPSLIISVYNPKEEKPMDVRLFVDTNPQTSTCTASFNGGPFALDKASKIMPILKSPVGAMQKGGGGNSGEDYKSSFAELETELSAKDLETHYRNQLVEAGWKLKEKGSDGSFAWSTWSYTDTDESGGNWSGILFVGNLGKENLRFAMNTVQLIS